MLGIAASNSIVAIQLKKAINQKGLKQASVATKAGYSAQELNDMLNGRRIMRAADIASIINVTIPYLASGAVIPPRSEFLAVLGDQKKGNNLEAPETLLRQIVREESGKGQGDGNTYNVTVNASGRKLLDIIISEAEMRRNRNGKNPFELA